VPPRPPPPPQAAVTARRVTNDAALGQIRAHVTGIVRLLYRRRDAADSTVVRLGA
jgi:hypothetical protein